MSLLNESLIKEDDSNKTSLLSCSLLLANGAIGKILFSSGLLIGAGILTLSLAVSKIGWGMSILMYVFFGRKLFLYFVNELVFAGLANGMLYTVQRYTRQDTYSGVVKKMYGRKMEIFVDIVQVYYCFCF